MIIRKYKNDDCQKLAELFYETVHKINARDYTKTQLDVWATGKVDIATWDKSFLTNNTLIVEKNGIIVGFGDMENSGYLDRLYVHKDYQNQGIATLILTNLEQNALKNGVFNFTTHASISAKSFFIKHSYHVVYENTVIKNDVELTNFIMKKSI